MLAQFATSLTLRRPIGTLFYYRYMQVHGTGRQAGSFRTVSRAAARPLEISIATLEFYDSTP